jgi:hypothetical protein
MTLAEAVDQWITAKHKLAALEPQLDEAAKILKAHFRKTGRAQYRDKIGYGCTTVQILDTRAVKAYLGKDLPKFQRSSTREVLSLLEGAA